MEGAFALMWFDRDNGVWNRFDKDNLNGVDPSTLALYPLQPFSQVVDKEARELSIRMTQATEKALELVREICPVLLLTEEQSATYYEVWAQVLAAKNHHWVGEEFVECDS